MDGTKGKKRLTAGQFVVYFYQQELISQKAELKFIKKNEKNLLSGDY